MSELGKLQFEFAQCAARLVLHIAESGHTCSLGEVKRSDEQAEINSIGETGRERVAALIEPFFPRLAAALRNNGKNNGVRLSVHQESLAVDLNLFKDGVYLTGSEDHRPFGEWWKAQHPNARWGGDFTPHPDGNHYSFEYNGVK